MEIRPGCDRDRGRTLAQAGLIVAAGLFVYGPALHGERLWDDHVELPPANRIPGWPALRDIWTGASGNDYYPLKETVQWLQCRLWGGNTLGFHLTNLGFHLLGAFLLWRLLSKLGVRHAWLGGLFLTVHPVAVESVAWISELKNVMSLPPLLMGLLSYLDWVDPQLPRPHGRGYGPHGRGYGPHERGYGLHEPDHALTGAATASHVAALVRAWLWFLVSMLCKSSGVMFPFMLWLLAWRQRGRLTGRDIRASLPFFAVSLVLGAVEVVFQNRVIGASGPVTGGTDPHLAVSGLASVFYFQKCLFPVRLLPIYPRWGVASASLAVWLPGIALASGLVWIWRCWHRGAPWARHALLGLGFFFGNLIPVLGFVPMAYQDISWAADHLAYLSLAGLVGLTAAAASGLATTGGSMRLATYATAAAAVAAMAGAARHHARHFRDEAALWTYTLRGNPAAWLAHDNLGALLTLSGRRDEAIREYRTALRLRPNFPEALNNLGNALNTLRRWPEAIANLEAAIRIRPGYSEAHDNLGVALAGSGQTAAAMEQYHEALRLQPDNALAEYNLGVAFANSRQWSPAIEHYRKALRDDPDHAETHNNLGIALGLSGHLEAALGEFQEALRLRPDFAAARDNVRKARQALGLRPPAGP